MGSAEHPQRPRTTGSIVAYKEREMSENAFDKMRFMFQVRPLSPVPHHSAPRLLHRSNRSGQVPGPATGVALP
ncbi:MAG: hypothetical protein LJE64_00455 [Desulfofustis sp.]|nr:hypothetical protein [Desulfofustis sp.]